MEWAPKSTVTRELMFRRHSTVHTLSGCTDSRVRGLHCEPMAACHQDTRTHTGVRVSPSCLLCCCCYCCSCCCPVVCMHMHPRVGLWSACVTVGLPSIILYLASWNSLWLYLELAVWWEPWHPPVSALSLSTEVTVIFCHVQVFYGCWGLNSGPDLGHGLMHIFFFFG